MRFKGIYKAYRGEARTYSKSGWASNNYKLSKGTGVPGHLPHSTKVISGPWRVWKWWSEACTVWGVHLHLFGELLGLVGGWVLSLIKWSRTNPRQQAIQHVIILLFRIPTLGFICLIFQISWKGQQVTCKTNVSKIFYWIGVQLRMKSNILNVYRLRYIP
jgi:hypothetical protein